MKQLKDKMITTKFTILLAVLLFLSMSILGIITYSSFAKMVDEKVEVLAGNVSKLINKNLDYLISDMQDTSNLLLTSRAIQKTFIYAGDPGHIIEYNENRIDAADIMNNMVNNQTCISAVYIGSKDMNIVSKKGDKLSMKIDNIDFDNPPWWLQTILENRGAGKWFHGRTIVDFDGNLLIYGREFKNLNTLEHLGIMLIALDTELLDDIFKEIESTNNMNIYIWEDEELIYYFGGEFLQQGEICLQDVEGKNGFREMNATRCYVHNVKNARSKWRISCVVPYEDFEREKNRLMGVIIFFVILLVIIGTWIGNRITKNSIMNTLGELRKFVNVLREKGNSDNFVFNSQDEVGMIGDEFVRVVQENEKLIVRLYESRYREKEAELLALQSEINPHFLYNALDSIFWAAEENGAENVAEMAVSLSNVFKMSLNQGKSICTLKEELDLIFNYMTVQNIRFNGRFELQMELPPELIDIQMLKLTLQPIVENAVQHGLEARAGKGKILITANVEKEDVTFIVRDDGVGFVVDEMNPYGKGFALRNVDERIKLYYGSKYGVTIESQPGEGTTVYIAVRKEIRYRNLCDRTLLSREIPTKGIPTQIIDALKHDNIQ